MRLTEAKLKELISEEYEIMQFEQMLFEGIEPMYEYELQKYRVNEDELLQEMDPISLVATAVGGFLSMPKILRLLGKLLKNLNKIPVVGRFFKQMDSSDEKDAKSIRMKVATFFDKFGEKYHKVLVKGFAYPIKMMYKLDAKDKGPDYKIPSDKEIEKIGEALMIFIIAACAAVGIGTIITHLINGHWANILTAAETALTAVKGIELGEFVSGGALPLALKFLETPHSHDDEDHGEDKQDDGEEK